MCDKHRGQREVIARLKNMRDELRESLDAEIWF
jgi:hypothetical protein